MANVNYNAHICCDEINCIQNFKSKCFIHNYKFAIFSSLNPSFPAIFIRLTKEMGRTNCLNISVTRNTESVEK